MSRRDSRLAGSNVLAYEGIYPESPILVFSNDRAPTTHDKKFVLGTLWINTLRDETWILVSLSPRTATWILLSSSTLQPITFNADVGTANPVDGVLNLIGDGNSVTSATLNTVTLTMDGADDGEVFIGSTAGSIAPALITSTGGTMQIVTGSNSITINDLGTSGIGLLDGDTGTATPDGAGDIIIAGGTNLNTTAAVANTVTIHLDTNITLAGTLTITPFGAGVLQTDAAGAVFTSKGNDGQLLISSTAGVPAWANITSPLGSIIITNGANTINLEYAGSVGIVAFLTDAGTATAAANNINVFGGTNINTTAVVANTLTVHLDTNVTLAGSLTITPFTAGVMQTDAGGAVSFSKGTDGQVLIGSTAGVPAWANITSSTLTITNAANSITIADSGDYPLNSSFLVIGDSDTISNNTWTVCGPSNAGDVEFDKGTNWTYFGAGYSTDPYYSAPATGKYFLQFQPIIYPTFSATPAGTSVDIWFGSRIVTTNRTYEFVYKLNSLIDQAYTLYECTPLDCMVEMTAGDTAKFYVYMYYYNGTPTLLSITNYDIKMSGYLIV